MSTLAASNVAQTSQQLRTRYFEILLDKRRSWCKLVKKRSGQFHNPRLWYDKNSPTIPYKSVDTLPAIYGENLNGHCPKLPLPTPKATLISTHEATRRCFNSQVFEEVGFGKLINDYTNRNDLSLGTILLIMPRTFSRVVVWRPGAIHLHSAIPTPLSVASTCPFFYPFLIN